MNFISRSILQFDYNFCILSHRICQLNIMIPKKESSKRIRYRGTKSRAASLAKARAAKKSKNSISPDTTPAASATASSSAPSPTPHQDIPQRQSASKRKLSYFTDQPKPAHPPSSLPTAVVDLNLVATLFDSFSCSLCGGSLALESNSRQGFVHSLSVICRSCSSSKGYTPEASTMTSSTLSTSKHHDMNRRMVVSFLNLGLGHAAMQSFCETMGMDCISDKTYRSHLRALQTSAKDLSQETLGEAVSKIRELRGVGPDTVIDLAVSFDGSWHKRGHTSKHGVALIIEIETGLVVDFHVMTTYCHVCAITPAEKKTPDWLKTHKASCRINHEGSSGLMEVAAAKTMWGRSLERGLRYTTMVSDGDSKTFTAITELKPYDVEVIKEECTNHVSKRLGTALRNLVSTEAKKGTTLGGRKAGSLTQVKISLLQSYYKKAVASRCTTVAQLRAKIMQAFYHSSSTDANPQHQECPTGVSSWCFWQRAVAHGRTPPSHNGKSSSFISAHVAKAILPVYERLTSDELLSRCLKGLTQNTNESIHATIWARCPKHIFVGVTRISIASALAVAEFNGGSRGLRSFLHHAGCKVTVQTVRRGVKRDNSRVAKAERKETLEAKRRRTDIARAATAAQQEYIAQEGGKSYEPGGF